METKTPIKMVEIKPVGQFLIDSGKGQQCSMGMFYSYSDVCVFLTQYAKIKKEEAEKELAEAREEIESLKQELRDNSTLAARQIVPAEMLVDDLTTEIERKNALIEQMRDALKLVKTHMHKTNDFYALDDVNAALLAAERSGNANS